MLKCICSCQRATVHSLPYASLIRLFMNIYSKTNNLIKKAMTFRNILQKLHSLRFCSCMLTLSTIETESVAVVLKTDP